MSDETTPQDDKAMPPASAGSVDELGPVPRATDTGIRLSLRRWIPVAESIPSDGRTVCVMACGTSTVGFRSTRFDGCEWWTACEETKDFLPTETSSVTHWMPLPSSPSDGK
jgi:hypothetical protein